MKSILFSNIYYDVDIFHLGLTRKNHNIYMNYRRTYAENIYTPIIYQQQLFTETVFADPLFNREIANHMLCMSRIHTMKLFINVLDNKRTNYAKIPIFFNENCRIIAKNIGNHDIVKWYDENI